MFNTTLYVCYMPELANFVVYIPDQIRFIQKGVKHFLHGDKLVFLRVSNLLEVHKWPEILINEFLFVSVS